MKTLSLLVFLFISLGVNSQGIKFIENPKWEDMVKKAKSENKLIFVDCYTKWCGPCQGLARNIFTKKELGEYYNTHFINVKYDMEEANGIFFGKQYLGEVVNFPTLLFIDPQDAKIVHKLVGSRPMEVFLNEGKRALAGEGLNTMHEKYKQGERGTEFMRDYFLALNNSNNKKLPELVDEYLQSSGGYAQLEQEAGWDFFFPYMQEMDMVLTKYILANYLKVARYRFVDVQKLDKNIENILQRNVQELTNVSFDVEKNSFVLRVDPDRSRFLKTNMGFLGVSFKRLEPMKARLAIYDALVNKEWEMAYNFTNSASAFGFAFAENLHPFVIGYIAQECTDKKLQERILNDLYKIQGKGENFIQHYNIYNLIASVAGNLGRKEEAASAEEKYNTIKSAREKMFDRKK